MQTRPRSLPSPSPDNSARGHPWPGAQPVSMQAGGTNNDGSYGAARFLPAAPVATQSLRLDHAPRPMYERDLDVQYQQGEERPLKVAILHYACGPIVGGVESIMTTHARLLEAEGHSSMIVAGRGDPESLGLPGLIIPELDSRHPQILEAQKALLAGQERAAVEFERWVDKICVLLED